MLALCYHGIVQVVGHRAQGQYGNAMLLCQGTIQGKEYQIILHRVKENALIQGPLVDVMHFSRVNFPSFHTPFLLQVIYLTFFVPEETAGKIALGADARIVLDAMDDVAIPASISYVASVAQFTPKSVETRVEREKLMFRVKAKIDPALLKQYVEYVKTGIPGVAWVRLDDKEPWPDFLKTPKEKGEPIPAANKPAETNETAAK